MKKKGWLISFVIAVAFFAVIGVVPKDEPKNVDPGTSVDKEMATTLDVGEEKEEDSTEENVQQEQPVKKIQMKDIPAYSGEPFVVLNGNEPSFTAKEKKKKAFEKYGALDHLGRCTTTYACIDPSLMPTEERGSIGIVKPTGWHTIKYDIVDGKYLYNRCHLIGFQLTGENANEQNLITGTRYMNVDGMLPFEDMVADYIRETGNRVLYRVTPLFKGNNLLAHGVQMEAYSVEDDGEGICFNVFVYNVQPGIKISYATGESKLVGNAGVNKDKETENNEPTSASGDYVLNTNTKKIHKHSCRYVDDIKDTNYEEYSGDIDELTEKGYEPCKVCKP